MTRDELEHIIRASGEITDQYEFMVIGSQSILGPVPNPEAIFTMSAEVDIYPVQAPELAEKIEGAIGDRVGYCLDVIDLFMSKAAAARDKDREFCVALLAHGYVTPAQALDLVSKMPMDVEQQRRLRATIRRWSRPR